MAQVVASDEAVAELARAIDGLLGLELHDLSDDDVSRLVVELEVQRSRLGGLGAAVVRRTHRPGQRPARLRVVNEGHRRRRRSSVCCPDYLH